MPRGVPGQVRVRNEAGEEVVGRMVHAACVIPVEDAERLRAHAREQGIGYAELMEQILRDAIGPVLRLARETEADLLAKLERAEQLRQLIEQHQREWQELVAEHRDLERRRAPSVAKRARRKSNGTE